MDRRKAIKLSIFAGGGMLLPTLMGSTSNDLVMKKNSAVPVKSEPLKVNLGKHY